MKDLLGYLPDLRLYPSEIVLGEIKVFPMEHLPICVFLGESIPEFVGALVFSLSDRGFLNDVVDHTINAMAKCSQCAGVEHDLAIRPKLLSKYDSFIREVVFVSTSQFGMRWSMRPRNVNEWLERFDQGFRMGTSKTSSDAITTSGSS